MRAPGAYGPRLRPLRQAYGAFTIGFLVLFVAWTRPWNPGQAWPYVRAFVDISSTVLPAAAGILAVMRARQLEETRRWSWAFLGSACFAWAVGNLAWTWYELVLGISAPTPPSWADAGYLSLLPLFGAGLAVLLAGTTAAATRSRSVLDGLLIAAALFFVAWPTFLQPIVDTALQQSGLPTQVTSLAYPVGDIALLSLLVLVISRAGPVLRGTLAWIGLALLALTYADVGYWYLGAQGTYETGSWTDSGWVAAFLILGYASLRPVAHQQDQQARPGLALTAVPFVLLAAALVVEVVEEVRDGFLEPFLFWMALLLVAVLLVRQFLFTVENTGLRRQAEAALQQVQVSQAERTLMLNTVTHDIMTPLSAARIQLHILGNRKDMDQKASHSLHIVDRNVDAVGRLARDLKDLANLEAGHFRLDLADVDLTALGRLAVESFRDAAEEVQLHVEIIQDDETLPVRGDRHRLDQVLFNLVSNAIRYTKQGSITVWCHRREGHAVVAVRDTGRGLDPQEAARLFRPFSQVHSKGEARERGTGLGLFISRSIAESHGGTLRVESPGRGHGSTFFLEVPLATIPGPPRPPVAAASPADAAEPHPGEAA